MNTKELHDILDDKNKKMSNQELFQVLYELKCDCVNEQCKHFGNTKKERFYMGEANAFQICIDLLEHLKGADNGN